MVAWNTLLSMKIGIYCRVSTGAQGEEDRYSLPQQHKDGILFAHKQGFDYQEYEDIESGASITRTGYLSLQAPLMKELYMDLTTSASCSSIRTLISPVSV